MPVKIKLQRKGTNKQPKYRIVIQEDREKLNGAVIDTLGLYVPSKDIFDIDKEKAKAWLFKGAQPTEKLRILLGKAGVMPAIDVSKLPKRKPKKELKAEKEAKKEEPKPEAKKEEAKPEPKKEEAKPAEKPEPKTDVETPPKEEKQ